MLSKLAKITLLRRFSTTLKTVNTSSSEVQTTKSQQNQITRIREQFRNLPTEVRKNIQTEQQHLKQVVNELKNQLHQSIRINFQTEVDKKTLILQTQTDSENYWKIGEVLTTASSAALVNQILGFPSYGVLAVTLGALGLGSAMSYSNLLLRTSSQITSIYHTSEGKLHIHSLKPSSVFSRKEEEELVELNNFKNVSFNHPLLNWIRKANNTNWVSVNGKLYWYNANPRHLRTNSHFYKIMV